MAAMERVRTSPAVAVMVGVKVVSRVRTAEVMLAKGVGVAILRELTRSSTTSDTPAPTARTLCRGCEYAGGLCEEEQRERQRGQQSQAK